MKKSIIAVFVLVMCCIVYGEMELDNIIEESFGKVLRVGLTTMKSKNKISIKSLNGESIIELNGSLKKLRENESIEVLNVNGKLYTDGEIYDKIAIRKSDIVTTLALSKDNAQYKKYRGDMELLIDSDEIVPVNIILAEEYLYSVVMAEIDYGYFPEEAIKVQSIISRTYLYKSLESSKHIKYDLADSVVDQVYKGMDIEKPDVSKVINSTANRVIAYEGKLITSYYYSNSGGYTANVEDVWNSKPVPYLKAVDDSGNWEDGFKAKWEYKISKSDISKLFNFQVNEIRINEKRNIRAYKIGIKGEREIEITGSDLRRIVGYSNILSTVLDVRDDGDKFYFNGYGSGHGVGLSQWGACKMAKKGYNCEEIIKYYYKNVEITDLNKIK